MSNGKDNDDLSEEEVQSLGPQKCAEGAVDPDGNIDALIADSNPKFPLTRTNADRILKMGPEATEPHVKGPGGAGADVEFQDPTTSETVDRVEVKCTQSLRAFDSELSYAVQSQAQGCKVVVQVPPGTDAERWMRRFWGNRKKLLDTEDPDDQAKLELYKNTTIEIVDPDGNVLLPRQPVYNPPGDT